MSETTAVGSVVRATGNESCGFDVTYIFSYNLNSLTLYLHVNGNDNKNVEILKSEVSG